jgi:hypothetical protein
MALHHLDATCADALPAHARPPPPQPAFVFPVQLGGGYAKYVAEAAAHEAGHNLGLSHDGNSTVNYYAVR